MVSQATVATSWPFRSSMRCLCLQTVLALCLACCIVMAFDNVCFLGLCQVKCFGLYRDETDNLLPTALDEQCAYSR